MTEPAVYLIVTLADSATSKIFAGFLWSGLVLLTAALLVTMKTRWGQSRPISKCIGLSVLAHILILAVLYGTNYIAIPSMDQPVAKLKFRQAKKDNEKDKQKKVIKEVEQPWNGLADSKLVPIPQPKSPPRKTTVSEQPPFAVERPKPVKDLTPKPKDVLEPQVLPKEQQSAKLITPLRPAPAARQPSDVTNATPPNSKKKQPTETVEDSKRSKTKRAPTTTEATTRPPLAKTKRSPASTGVPPSPRTIGPVQAKPLHSSSGSNSADPKATARILKNIPRVYAGRVAPRTQQWLRSQGGTPQTETAVQLALDWLARNQSRDGRWDARRHGAGQERHVLGQERERAGIKADTAMTGLALLAFLGSGSTHKYGKHQKSVKLGVQFLIAEQHRSGSLAGSATLFARMYCHGIATFALAEAYSMTGDAELKPYVERAIQFTVKTQNQVTGGWRYQVGDRGDMSQFGWQLLALKSAEQGGVPIPRRTRLGMLRFLRSVSFGRAGGLASYRPGRAKSRTMTAEALVCRHFLKTSNPSLSNEAVRYIRQEVPSPANRNFYYWYYASLAMHKVGDGNWRAWNRSLQQALITTQSRGGKDDGSWSPQTRWGGYGGRVYTTAMAAMCLEVYYRFAKK